MGRLFGHPEAKSRAFNLARLGTRRAGTRRHRPHGLAALGLAALFAFAPAQAVDDLIIAAAGPDLNGDGVTGDDIVGSIAASAYPGATSVVTATAVGNLLASRNVGLTVSNSIAVNSGVTWNASTFLSLAALAPAGVVSFNAPVTGREFSVTANRVDVQSNLTTTGPQSWFVGNVVWTAGSLSSGSQIKVDVPAGKAAGFPPINQAASLAKHGQGTLTLAQPSNVIRTTHVREGALRSANTSGSATGSGDVLVWPHATLTGTGRHAGPVYVMGFARLEPGSPVGALTLSGGLYFHDGAVIDAALGTSSDRIVVNGGTLTGSPSAGGVTVNFSDAGGLTTGTYVLIDGRGSTLSGFTASDFKVGTAPENFSFTFRLEGNVLSVIVGPPAYGTGYLFTARDCRLRTTENNDIRDYDCVNVGPAGQGFLGTRQQRWSAPVGGNSGGGINSGAVSFVFNPSSSDIDASWGDGGSDHANAVAAQGLSPASVPLGSVFGSIGFAGTLSLPVLKAYSRPSDFSRTNSNIYAYQKYTYGGLTSTQLPLALDMSYVVGNYSSPDDVFIHPLFPSERPGGAGVDAKLSVVDASLVTIQQLDQAARNIGLNNLTCGGEQLFGWPAGSILGQAVVDDRTNGGGVRTIKTSVPIHSCASIAAGNPQPIALAAGQEFFVTAGLQVPARGRLRQPGDPSTAIIEENGFVHADNTMLAVVDPAAPAEAVQAFVANTTPECAPNCEFARIDVKPGDELNCINPRSQGSIPVALFGSNILPVSQVDQATLRFGSLAPASNKSKLRCSIQRVNADDQDDLVCHFGNRASNWRADQASETLTGATLDGDPIEATDKVCIEQ